MKTSFLVRSILIGIIVLAVFSAGLAIYSMWLSYHSGSKVLSDGKCNVAVIPVEGEIYSYEYYYGTDWGGGGTSDDYLVEYIQRAERDHHIKGILLEVESPGGLVVPPVIVMNALKRSPLPSVALIENEGTSGAYRAALGTDHIVAYVSSAVGSIGINWSYSDNAIQNEQSGLTYHDIASGKFKTVGDANKAPTKEDINYIQSIVDSWGTDFIQDVARERNLPEEKVRELAHGGTMTSATALSGGLIDEIGDDTNARKWLADTLAVSPDKIILCDKRAFTQKDYQEEQNHYRY